MNPLDNERPTLIGDGVPRAFTCDYCPQLREAIARVEARQEGDSKAIMRIETTLQGKLNGIVKTLQNETVTRVEQRGLDMADLAALKSRMRQMAATVSAVVAFLVAIGGQLVVKYLLK